MEISSSAGSVLGQLKLVLSTLAGLALCWMALSSARVQAQALSGINGSVIDSSGAVVTGATVTITNDATGVSSKTVTTTAGTYSVTDLIPGTYTVRIEATGFQGSVIK